MIVIEIRPHRWSWKVFEAPGVEPVFLEKRLAIDYAETRACFRSGEIRILDSTAMSNALFRSTRRIESCDSVIQRRNDLCVGRILLSLHARKQL